MYTYIIKDKLSGFYKIGKTKDIKKRFSTLSTSNLNLKIINILPTNQEKFLHKLFINNKIQKEWFYLSEKNLQDIDDLKFEIMKEIEINF